ncbi:MAG: DegT/DnrJ/EryC1/StrS family aminotransferase [Planctomycetes bacterium]|nr:DegT/DnrJ/EryC1/StrS family aminotransferase [Planctomycetota bacterium]
MMGSARPSRRKRRRPGARPGAAGVPHSRPTLDREDVRAVAATLRSGSLGRGAECAHFERELAACLGQRHCTATASGTAALHLALLALGAGPRTEVILPSYACTALLNAVHYTGAKPLVVDVEPGHWNVSPEEVARVISRRTRAVIAPHAFGSPADVRTIRRLGVKVIEDCATSLGALSDDGRPVGEAGDVAVTSFYATKLLTTGHGGALLTSDAHLRDIVENLVNFDNRDDYIVRYNAAMSDFQAALGRAQLRRLPHWLAARARLAARYQRELADLPLTVQSVRPGCAHGWFRFLIAVTPARRDALERHLAARGIEAKRPVYRPLHRYLGLSAGRYPATEEAHQTVLSLPLYPTLKEAEVARVARAVREFLTTGPTRRASGRTGSWEATEHGPD